MTPTEYPCSLSYILLYTLVLLLFLAVALGYKACTMLYHCSGTILSYCTSLWEVFT